MCTESADDVTSKFGGLVHRPPYSENSELRYLEFQPVKIIAYSTRDGTILLYLSQHVTCSREM